jgi:DNA-binding HxlR family transcriptional regulator
MNQKYRSHCPINYAQEVFGDKWSLLIIRDLMFKGKKYYNEFLNSDEKISTNILANRLGKLEKSGLITKRLDVENNSRKVYSLTQKSIDLLPMLLEMIAWAAKYDDQTGTPQEFINKLESDRESLILEILASLVTPK